MIINTSLDPISKIAAMGNVTPDEPVGDQPLTERKQGNRYQSRSLAECITHVSAGPTKKPMLATMLTTACERNCNYCIFRAGRSQTKRFTISPDELAKGFDQLQRAKQVEGLFLSSGIIKGSVTTQDKLIDTATIIRKKYGFKGFVHLKIMPGSEYDQVYRAMQLADRVSVNMEGATADRLSALAPKKDWANELLKMLQWAEQLRRDHPDERLAKTVTQFVVGAVGDTDLELLSLSDRLFRQLKLTRVYYSPFGPVANTPFENVARTDPQREHRLYQASFLLRDYNWNVEDLPFATSGNMPLDVDPKKAWADEHLRTAPIDLMKADREALMRVPGIGATGAEAILNARRETRLTDLASLRKLGIRAPEQAAPYILLDGRRVETQLSMF
jgi:predicted DNA-binding helix-hairpin-helix protein